MELYETLKKLNIDYEEIEHNAVFTIEEALKENIPSRIEGIECKNLFCKNKDCYYLIFLEASKRADLKAISKVVGVSHLSFASIEELKDILNLDMGSVTPLGIINDDYNKVTLIIDQELKGNRVLVHPNINTKTISLEFEDLIKFIKYTNHSYILI